MATHLLLPKIQHGPKHPHIYPTLPAADGPLTFILLCKGLCLFPKVKGLKDVGCDGDIGGGHVVDGDWSTNSGSHPATPQTAST